MSESKANRSAAIKDGPYRRIAILIVICVAAVLLLFAVNVLARGFGGNEKRLAEVLAKSLSEPYLHAKFDVSRQAQTNSFGIKGDIHSVKLKDISADLTVTASAQSQSLNIPVEVYGALGDDPTVYVKGSKLDTLADMIGQSTPQINADIASISEKLEGKWLVIPQADTSASSCVSSILEDVQSNPDTAKKIGKLYLKNRFIVVESIEEKGGGAEEYTVRYDNDALSGFTNDIKKEDFYKSVDACADDLEVPGSVEQPQQPQGADMPESDSTTKLLVEGGKVTSINSTSSYEGRVDTFSASVDYKKGKQLAAPTQNTVKVESIKSEITSVTRFIMQQQMAASAQPTQ